MRGHPHGGCVVLGVQPDDVDHVVVRTDADTAASSPLASWGYWNRKGPHDQLLEPDLERGPQLVVLHAFGDRLQARARSNQVERVHLAATRSDTFQ